MPKGYWIVRVDIADPERYKDYIAANAAPFRKHEIGRASCRERV